VSSYAKPLKIELENAKKVTPKTIIMTRLRGDVSLCDIVF